MCEFHESTCNGLGDIWWTDNPIYFSSIDNIVSHTAGATLRLLLARDCSWQRSLLLARRRNFFPINAPGMDRFHLLNLGVLGYGLELIFLVVIAIIVSLTLTITLIATLTRI